MDPRVLDRAVGALLGSAAGDALGVPYEFGTPPLDAEPEQKGGGLGGIAPGQWSDDTEMACVIAQVAATGADLRSEEALDAIADGFLRWYGDNPPDVGVQTRAVLGGVPRGPGAASRLRARAQELHARTGKTAGNGSLMRTGPVALAHLGDPEAIATAARAISDLTHPDPMAGDACVLWSLAIDHAIRNSELDVRVGLPHVGEAWRSVINQAEQGEPASFENNGWVVAAFQAAWSTLTRTSSLRDALVAGVRAGHDTDTVAAITGSLAGARYGGSAVPFTWRRRLHGWPDLRARDLTSLAVLAVRSGEPDAQGWPTGGHLSSYAGAATGVVVHPDDDGVLLGAVGALRPGVADAVVSLCRLGAAQVPLSGVPAEDHLEVWLIDAEDANNDVPLVLRDTAEAVRTLRAEGKTVLLHCAHAETRTPVSAAVYGAQVTGTSVVDAMQRVLDVLPSARPRPSLREIAEQLDMTPEREFPATSQPSGESMTPEQFFATATGGRQHLRQCHRLLDKEVFEVPAGDERPVCDTCQKEIDGFGRTYFDDLDVALDYYQAPVENRALIKQHLAEVVYDQIWLPNSDSYIALGLKGRGVAWTGKNYVEPVPGTRVLLPGYAGAEHGPGKQNRDDAWGKICPETFIAHPLNGHCPDCGAESGPATT